MSIKYLTNYLIHIIVTCNFGSVNVIISINHFKEEVIMDAYLVSTNAQANGDHEVHKSSCNWLPEPQHRLNLGYFNNCHEAMVEAKKIYPTTADGCHYCCPACDTR
jgi:hypothetical protein